MNFNATTIALNMLKSRNPKMANMIENMMKQGADPRKIIQDGINSGQITQNQLNQLRMLCGQFGIPTSAIDSFTKK